MKDHILAKIFGIVAGLLAVFLTGCGTFFDGETTTTTEDEGPPPNVLRVGDRIKITFGVGNLAPQEHQISETGTVTLPLIGAVRVVDKTIDQVEQEIRDKYVPAYYKWG